MAQQSARALAFAALSEWRLGGRFADPIIHELLAGSGLTGPDRAFATDLFYGALRNLTLLDFWISLLRPGSLDHDSRDLLRLGLYQLFFLRTAGHAAVFETVALAGRRSRSFVNAVLRAAIRRADELHTSMAEQPLATRRSHPEFLLKRWSAAFGDDATAALCDWNNQPAPVYARMNTLRVEPELFRASYPTAASLPDKRNFVRLDEISQEALARGECYIQDPSTSLACELLAPQPGETVLDACAAPGGKSSLLAELMGNEGQLFACDRDAARCEILRENLERLGVKCARVLRKDWNSGELPSELRESCFDRILVDAPCSNTGVMRRRVDLRWRLRPEDFPRMHKEQIGIVRAVVALLKPGGSLVYSTCSIEAEENVAVVERLLKEFPFLEFGAQESVLPFRDHFDGAFAAKLVRAA